MQILLVRFTMVHISTATLMAVQLYFKFTKHFFKKLLLRVLWVSCSLLPPSPCFYFSNCQMQLWKWRERPKVLFICFEKPKREREVFQEGFFPTGKQRKSSMQQGTHFAKAKSSIQSPNYCYCKYTSLYFQGTDRSELRSLK